MSTPQLGDCESILMITIFITDFNFKILMQNDWICAVKVKGCARGTTKEEIKSGLRDKELPTTILSSIRGTLQIISIVIPNSNISWLDASRCPEMEKAGSQLSAHRWMASRFDGCHATTPKTHALSNGQKWPEPNYSYCSIHRGGQKFCETKGRYKIDSRNFRMTLPS